MEKQDATSDNDASKAVESNEEAKEAGSDEVKIFPAQRPRLRNKDSQRKEEGEKPGSEATNSPVQRNRHRNKDARRRLQELEENVVAKSRQDTVRATTPGAFAEAGDGTSSDAPSNRAEKDALTKRRARRGRSVPTGSGAEAALNRLESDVVAKKRAGRPVASVPGAVASTSGSQTVAKSDSDSRIGVGGIAESATGTVISRTSSSDQRAKLRDLESDTLAKTLARAGRASSTTADPAARKMAAYSGSGNGGDPSSAYSSIRTLERDVLAKSRSRSRTSPRRGSQSALAAVSEESPGSERIMDTMSSRDLCDDGLAERDSSAPRQNNPSAMVDVPFGAPAHLSSSMDPGAYPDRSAGFSHGARISPAESHSTPLMGVDPLDGEDENALQAVAVVNATGVAVVMSDEEIKWHEEQKSRRYLCFGCIGFILVTVAIVVPLVLVLGGSDSSELSETEPTAPLSIAPSSSPSLQPTSSGLTASIDFLTSNGISELEALQDRETPQFLALEWINDKDFLALNFDNPQEQDQWIQRYLLATFYFATHGDSWIECSRGSAGCATSGTSWLTIEQECDWLAVLCNDSNVVTGIAFRKFLLDDSAAISCHAICIACFLT